MTSTTQPARFPALWTMASLTLATAAAALVARPLVALLVGEGPQVTPAILTMSGLAWAIGIVGLMPVILLGPLGVMGTVWGYFMGSALRVVLGTSVVGMITIPLWIAGGLALFGMG